MRSKAQSNVVALRGPDLPGLGVAATSGTGNRIGGSRNEIWLCPAYSRDGPLMLYVKLGLPTRAMFVEALCAQLAHCLQLDCPAPYIVTVRPRHVGRPDGALVLAFGAEDQSERSLARPLQNLTMLLELMKRHKVADLVCAFDEWIANDVRSPSDILVSPEPRLFLIDHEAALSPAVQPDEAVTNWLAARLMETMTLDKRKAFLGQLHARLAALHRINLSAEPPLATQYSPDGVPIYQSLLEFLRERLGHLDRLLSERVIPEQRRLALVPAHAGGTVQHAPG